ncbi:MAG: ABC transporter substrate-binding protein [Spirochaetaceae bacterium]|nr:MAG: ABC transporter substrate-binding protein [Spirochaetaceae bacterium]
MRSMFTRMNRCATRRAVQPAATALLALVLFAGVASGVVAQDGHRAVGQDGPRVVATTPWTAAFALAAGVRDVHVLAPYEMRHPPEYELRATDVARVQNADLLVFGGYEAMMSRLRDAIGRDSPRMVQIRTDHARTTIAESVMTIALETGTVPAARANVAEIVAFLDDWRAEIARSRVHDVPVVVHAFQQAIARELGIEPVGVFGPGPMSARQISELTQRRPALMVDVWHNEAAGPLRETVPDAVYVSLMNFPGRDGTRTLMDVLQHKRRALAEAVAQLE